MCGVSTYVQECMHMSLILLQCVNGVYLNLKIFRIRHAYWCILSLIYPRLFQNFRVRGVTLENLLGSFLQFGAFYRLYDTFIRKMVL